MRAPVKWLVKNRHCGKGLCKHDRDTCCRDLDICYSKLAQVLAKYKTTLNKSNIISNCQKTNKQTPRTCNIPPFYRSRVGSLVTPVKRKNLFFYNFIGRKVTTANVSALTWSFLTCKSFPVKRGLYLKT